jgi:hypothetical protein
MADPIAQLEAERNLETPFDTSDPQQVNAARKKSARLERENLEFVKKMMADRNGRAWIYKILLACHLGGNPFVPGMADSTAYKLGEMNIGNLIRMDIESAAPEQWVTMLREAREPKG